MQGIIRDISFKAMLGFLRFSKAHEVFRPFYGGSGHILKFHRVIPPSHNGFSLNHDLEVTPSEFENCIKYCLKKNYDIISLDELHNLFQKGENPPNKFVLFTFDDGYLDCYKYAYPLLKKYGVPFSINLCPGLMERRAFVWWYLLEDLILHHRNLTIEQSHQEINYECETGIKKYLVFQHLRKQILAADEAEYHLLLNNLFTRYNVPAAQKSSSMILTWDHVREMNRDPLVTMAAHTDHHLPLSPLSEARVREEIGRSREIIEDQIGAEVEHFAYPYGHREAGRREFAIVKSLGFKTGITTRFGNIFPEHHDFPESLPSLYKISKIRKDKFLDVFTSGAISALAYRLNRVITV